MDVKQYDDVKLKDGRTGTVVEVFDGKGFLVDVGSSPKDWETIDVKIDEIEAVLKK